MQTSQRSSAGALLLVLIAAGCASAPRTSRIDDALLAEVEQAALNNVIEARAERDTADVALAKAERDTEWAAEQVDLARSSLKVARAELDDTKLEVTVADKSGPVAQLEAAQVRHEYAIARADVARERLALRKRQHELAKLGQKLSLEKSRLQNARVEQQKALAVFELDRVAAKRVPVQDYRNQVRYHETEVQIAQVRFDAAAVYMQEAEAEFEAMHMRAESLKPATNVDG